MRAAVYNRISYDSKTGTVDEGLGIARQQEDCLGLIDREDWTLVDVYNDNSVSAWSGKDRPAWKQMLAACVEGRVDVLVAWRDDRLWRNVTEERQVSAMLREHGVEVIAFASGRRYVLADVDDQFMSGIQAIVAENESAKKSVRVKRKMEQLAADGRWRGGVRPYGYRRATEQDVERGVGQPGGLIVVPEEAEILRGLARRVLAGEGLTGLAHELNADGVPSATGGNWRTQTIRSLLTNPVHVGQNHFRGEVIGQGRWEPMLDLASHESLVALISSRRRGPGRPPTRLLTGIMVCYACGGPVNATARKDIRMYQCKRDPETKRCGGPSVQAVPVETVVVQELIELFADSDGLAERMAKAGDVNVTELSGKLGADRERLDLLVADYYAGEVPKSAYLMARHRLEKSIDQAQQIITEAAATNQLDVPIGDYDALVAWWEVATIAQQRAAAEAAIERIELQPWRPEYGRRFNRDRIRIIWRY